MSACGWPLVGDGVYGRDPASRQALHAWRVTLPHPVTRVQIDLEAPIPPDFGAERFET
jgi:23S rRNA pseudouridine1911/1915/1917 synthase